MSPLYRILYVDDEPTLLEITKLFLERDRAFAVDTLTSAVEALERLKTVRYDVIVSDYQMPKMNGITFLKQLKESGDTTPFIIFTGKGREEIVIEALNNGADFYLHKGGEPKSQFAELAHKIQTAVNRQRIEKLAKDTERRLYDIINFLPDATFAIDTRGQVIAWNRAIEEMTGVPASEMLGKGNYEYALPFYAERRPILIDLVSVPDEELTQSKYAVIKKDGNILIAETTLPRPHGKYSVLLGKASLLFNEDGNCVGAIESIRDITEQKRVEESLRESGRRVTAMASNIPGVVYRFFVNPDGSYGFDYISGRCLQILGIENDPARFFERVTNCIVQNDRERFLISVRHAISTKNVWEFESQFVKPSGEKIWIIAVSSPAMENDRLIFDGVIFDNSERKRAEEKLLKAHEELSASYEKIAATEEKLRANLDEITRQERALRENEDSFQSLVETAPDPIYISDGERFIYVNPAMVRLIGATSASQLLGTSLYDRIHSSFHEEIRKRARVVIDERKPVGLRETVYLKMDGTPVDIESAVATFRYQNNIAGLVILRDITRRKQAEQQLRDSEEKYRTLFNNTNDEIYIHEIQPDGMPGKFLEVNDRMCRRLGYSREELLTMTVYDIVSDEHRKKMDAIGKELSKSGECTFTGEHRKKDGSVFPVEIKIHRFTLFNKEIVLATARDITEWKLAEEMLHESETKYRTIIEQSYDGIFIAQDGQLVFYNPALATMTGYSSDELYLISIADLIAPEDREMVLTRHRERSSGKVLPEVYEFSLLHHDKTSRIRVKMNVTSASIGGKPATIGTLHNVTDERKREEALRESEEKYRSVINNIQDMFYRTDKAGNLIMASPSCLSKLGYESLDEGIFKSVSDMFYYSPEKREELLRILVEKGSVEDYEVQLKRKDGTPLWISTSSHFYRDERGEITGVEGIFRDITERKRAEELLQRMVAKITTLNNITRHNMINTLTGLLGMIAMAQDPSTRPELDNLLLNIKNLTKNIQEQIEFSRDFQAAGVQEPCWQSVQETVSSAAQSFAGSGVSIINTISGWEVYADPLLKKAFDNLILNAVRNGGHLTTITFTEKQTDTGLSIICQDDGPGFPATVKETLFEQGTVSFTNMELFLVKEILSITGITISENGEPGKGARFEITVPQGIFRREAGSQTRR